MSIKTSVRPTRRLEPTRESVKTTNRPTSENILSQFITSRLLQRGGFLDEYLDWEPTKDPGNENLTKDTMINIIKR